MTDVLKAAESSRGITRRRVVGYLIAAPTLVAAARLGLVPGAQAAVPTKQLPVDLFDLSDLLTAAATPTNGLLRVTVNRDGTASFDLPRAEVGQGITTAVAMTIADELELPVEKVKVALADARPELVFNQLTAASNTMHALYEPSAPPRRRREGGSRSTAARELGVDADRLRLDAGVFTAPGGATRSFGELAAKAAWRRRRRSGHS